MTKTEMIKERLDEINHEIEKIEQLEKASKENLEVYTKARNYTEMVVEENQIAFCAGRLISLHSEKRFLEKLLEVR